MCMKALSVLKAQPASYSTTTFSTQLEIPLNMVTQCEWTINIAFVIGHALLLRYTVQVFSLNPINHLGYVEIHCRAVVLVVTLMADPVYIPV
ncbi:hypothetical protein FKM82_004917 [Ascaphus truei]